MIHNQKNQNRYSHSILTLYPQQQQAIEKLLGNLVQQVPAQFILLADITGQVISTHGDHHGADLTALGALVVGDLAASHEIARLTGQYQADQMVFREGQTINSFTCGAGLELALLIQVSTNTPLGWARMLIRKAAAELSTIVANPPEQLESDLFPQESLLQQEEDLTDLFSDALDNLWRD